MKNRIHKVIPTVAAGAFMFAPLAIADEDETPEMKFRQSAMGIFKFYLKPMGGMMKGKIPYNAETFAAKARGLATAASLDVLAGFPGGSEGATNAKAKIWENWSDFEGKFHALQKESTELANIAASGDEAAIKAQFGKTAEACGNCHDEYKEK